MKKRLYILPLLAVLLLGLFSCSKENKLDELPLPTTTSKVLFSINNSGNEPSTRASQAGGSFRTKALDREKEVNSLYAVVFDNADKYYKTIQAAPVGGSTNTYEFDMLRVGEGFKMHLVANPNSELIDKLQDPALTKDALGVLLIETQKPGEDNEANNFLMTSDLTSGINTAENSTFTVPNPISLTRAAARFDFFNTVEGLKMTKITFKNRATQTRFEMPSDMTGINLEDKVYKLTDGGAEENEFLATVYGYENTEKGSASKASMFILEGTYKGKPIKPQEIVLEKIPVTRNYLYSIIISSGKAGDFEHGTPETLTFEIKVNDWREGATIEWENIIDEGIPTFTVTGENVTASPDENPTNVKVNQYTATTVTVNVESASSASSKLETSKVLPAGCSITPGAVGNKDGKLTQEFTIELSENLSTERSFEFVLSNVFNPGVRRTFTLKQRGKQDRPKMAIEYVTEYNLTQEGKIATSHATDASGYFTWDEAKRIVPSGYKLPSKEEWTGIFPYNSYVRFSDTTPYNGVSEEIAVQGVNNGNAKTYTADYRNRGNGISYALRFKGGDNSMLAAYRYERLGTFANGSTDARVKVTVRYLGDSFNGDVETIAKEEYWNNNTGDDVSREFYAFGWKNPSGSLGYRGTYGLYWTSSEYSSGNAWGVYFDSSDARVYGNSSYKTYGRSVRLFVKE